MNSKLHQKHKNTHFELEMKTKQTKTLSTNTMNFPCKLHLHFSVQTIFHNFPNKTKKNKKVKENQNNFHINPVHRYDFIRDLIKLLVLLLVQPRNMRSAKLLSMYILIGIVTLQLAKKLIIIISKKIKSQKRKCAGQGSLTFEALRREETNAHKEQRGSHDEDNQHYNSVCIESTDFEWFRDWWIWRWFRATVLAVNT